MKNTWNNLWKGLLIWVTAYSSIIAFALCGGYVIVKEKENEVLQKETKKAFIVILIFTVIDLIRLLLVNIASMGSLTFTASRAYVVIFDLVDIAEIVTYVVLAFCFVLNNAKVNEQTEEESEDLENIEDTEELEDLKKLDE